MKDHVFKINADGTVVGLYTDAVPLHALGALHVERASSVEFDNVQQAWVVTLADGTVLPGTFTTRDDALACEVAHLHAELKGEPTTPREGQRALDVPAMSVAEAFARVHVDESVREERIAQQEYTPSPIIENMRELHTIVASSALGTCRNGHVLCLRAACHVPGASQGKELQPERGEALSKRMLARAARRKAGG